MRVIAQGFWVEFPNAKDLSIHLDAAVVTKPWVPALYVSQMAKEKKPQQIWVLAGLLVLYYVDGPLEFSPFFGRCPPLQIEMQVTRRP